MLKQNLTMDAWDEFTILLKENKLQAFLNEIYKHKQLAMANSAQMKVIILETA